MENKGLSIQSACCYSAKTNHAILWQQKAVGNSVSLPVHPGHCLALVDLLDTH